MDPGITNMIGYMAGVNDTVKDDKFQEIDK